MGVNRSVFIWVYARVCGCDCVLMGVWVHVFNGFLKTTVAEIRGPYCKPRIAFSN